MDSDTRVEKNRYFAAFPPARGMDRAEIVILSHSGAKFPSGLVKLVDRTVTSYDSSLAARSNASRKNGMIVRRSSAVRTITTCETRLSPCTILMKYGALALRPR